MPRAGVEWASRGGRFMEQRENSDAGEAREGAHSQHIDGVQ